MKGLEPLPPSQAAAPVKKQKPNWRPEPVPEEKPAVSKNLETLRNKNDFDSASEEESEYRLGDLNREPGTAEPLKPVFADRPALDRLSLDVWDTTALPLDDSNGAGFSVGSRHRSDAAAEFLRRPPNPDRDLLARPNRSPALDRPVLPYGREEPGLTAFPQTRRLMEQIGRSFTPAPAPALPSPQYALPSTASAPLLQPAISATVPDTGSDRPESTRPSREPPRMRSAISYTEFKFKKSTDF